MLLINQQTRSTTLDLWHSAELSKHLFCIKCVKTQQHSVTQRTLSTWQTGDVCVSSSLQLLSALCDYVLSYVGPDLTAWDTSFPLVILSLHQQLGDDISSTLSTLGSVLTTTHTKNIHLPIPIYARTHTHTLTGYPPSSPTISCQSHVKHCALLLVTHL